MADPELVKVMDYILNRCDEAAIDVVAAAVVRRRRELSLFGSQHMPDPQKMARELSSRINVGASIGGLKETVRSMAERIIRREAPELTDAQINELTAAWIPGEKDGAPGREPEKALPHDLLEAMVDQFVSFSLGRMSPREDKTLRDEMGSWPERYWKSFPQVIQLIISEFLKGGVTEGEFKSQIETALAMEGKG
jgi:hypothetical protein